LQKTLSGLDAWITGVRRDQSSVRAAAQVLELYEFDKLRGKGILKINPLVGWSRDQVWNYIRTSNRPLWGACCTRLDRSQLESL